MGIFFLCIAFLMNSNGISGLLPEGAVHTQTIKDDCTGDENEEIILVYDMDGRFGTEDYQGTCVAVIEEIEGDYHEVYKTKLSADTKIRLVKIFDELPPFIEIQWFHSGGGGNTYICYDKRLRRFREILDIESGGLNKQDIDGDGTEEIFTFEFKSMKCNEKGEGIHASFLTFYRWSNNSFVSLPEKPYMMRPGITYFATQGVVERPNIFIVSPERLDSPWYKGPEDLSFRFYSRMDSSGLSISIQITDDAILQKGEGDRIIYGDHLVILLDTDLEEDFCSRTVSEDDIAIAISPGNLVDVSPVIINLNPASQLSRDIAGDSDFLIEKLKDGYEVSIRFDLGEEPLRKKLFGFGIILFDRDRVDKKYPEFKMSWPVDLDKKDPTTWGNLYLFEH